MAIFESNTNTRIAIRGPGNGASIGIQFSDPNDSWKGGFGLEEATKSLVFSTNADESNPRMVITDDGNIGIGTVHPKSQLSVGGDGYSYSAIYGEAPGSSGYGVYGSASGNNGIGVVGRASSTSGINHGGYFVAAGSDGRAVYGFASHSGTVTNYGGYFQAWGRDGRAVYGTASGFYGHGVYGRANGTNGIGVSGYSSGTNGTGVKGNGDKYDFYASGGGENYASSSSIRWKNNIVEIDNPLEKLADLRGVYFDWDEEHGGQHDVGMIAEEVGKVLPEIVVYEENGIDADGMDYSKLTPLLIEVAKAQQKLIEELQAEIEILKSR